MEISLKSVGDPDFLSAIYFNPETRETRVVMPKRGMNISVYCTTQLAGMDLKFSQNYTYVAPLLGQANIQAF